MPVPGRPPILEVNGNRPQLAHKLPFPKFPVRCETRRIPFRLAPGRAKNSNSSMTCRFSNDQNEYGRAASAVEGGNHLGRDLDAFDRSRFCGVGAGPDAGLEAFDGQHAAFA